MEHYHFKVPGWFTFPKLYSEMVEKYNNAHFVEVGAWQGSSTTYMAVEIINSKKNIKFSVYDIWGRYSLAGLNTKTPETLPEDYVYGLFLNNIDPVKHIVSPTKLPSNQASTLHANESLDFIFIDANHEYEAVMSDLMCWYPKLKKGGTIAGHDYYDDEGVQKAVRQFFGVTDDKLYCGERCWRVNT